MSEEEKNSSEQGAASPEQGDEPVAEEQAADESPQAEEAPAEQSASADQAPAEDAAAEQPAPAEDEPAPAEEPEAERPATAPAEAAEAEPKLTPKQQRKLERSRHAGDAKPERGPDERAAERLAVRRAKGADRRRARQRARSKHEGGEGTPPAEHRPGSKKVRQGTVVSSKADKTITVQIEVVRRHPVYEKVVRRSATIHAHDERNDANAGDVVRVVESRPLSKTKRWRLVEVLERAR